MHIKVAADQKRYQKNNQKWINHSVKASGNRLEPSSRRATLSRLDDDKKDPYLYTSKYLADYPITTINVEDIASLPWPNIESLLLCTLDIIHKGFNETADESIERLLTCPFPALKAVGIRTIPVMQNTRQLKMKKQLLLITNCRQLYKESAYVTNIANSNCVAE